MGIMELIQDLGRTSEQIYRTLPLGFRKKSSGVSLLKCTRYMAEAGRCLVAVLLISGAEVGAQQRSLDDLQNELDKAKAERDKKRRDASAAGGRQRAEGSDKKPVTTGAAPRPSASAPPVDPFVYFLQAGAFVKAEDADQQRAKLSTLGFDAKVSEREQSGRTIYRVRLGPFDRREPADALQAKLSEGGIEAVLVRAEK